jgi:hypothetical protein
MSSRYQPARREATARRGGAMDTRQAQLAARVVGRGNAYLVVRLTHCSECGGEMVRKLWCAFFDHTPQCSARDDARSGSDQ